MQIQAIRWAILLLLLIINVSLVWKIGFISLVGGNIPLWDFDIYYRMVGDVLSGLNPYTLPYMQTSGPPLVILFFVPFILMPLEVARGLIALANFTAILGTGYVLANKYNRGWLPAVTLAFTAAFLLTFPVRFNFIVGQPNLILMWLSALLLTSSSQNMRGVAAGIMAIVKTNYVLVAASLWRKQRRSLTVMIGIVGMAGLLSVLLFRPASYLDFVTTKGSSFLFSVPQTTDLDYYNQSLRATLARFHMGELYPVIFLVVMFTGLWYLFKTGDTSSGLMLSLLLSPIVWQHYIPVIYPLLVITGLKVWQNNRLRWWWWLSAGLLTIHLPQIHGLPATFFYSMCSSHYFLGLIILLFICVANFRSTLQNSFDTV